MVKWGGMSRGMELRAGRVLGGVGLSQLGHQWGGVGCG